MSNQPSKSQRLRESRVEPKIQFRKLRMEFHWPSEVVFYPSDDDEEEELFPPMTDEELCEITQDDLIILRRCGLIE